MEIPMRSMARRVFGMVGIACSFSAAAIGEEAKAPALIYSPWTKNCVNGLCFTGSGARTTVGCASTATAIAATIVGRAGDAKKILHITLQRPDNAGGAARLMIDENLVGDRPFARCFVNNCTAEFEAGAELIDQLKHGQWLVVEAVEDAGSINPPIRRSLPLLHFSDAYDGPGLEPKAFIIERGLLEKEMLALKERAEQEKRDNEERKARCGSDP
jgi:invasion protein IalB